MGQTRLLLLVLGAVIILLAIAAGIRLFDEGMTDANFDGLLRDSIAIASNAKAWKTTPQALGGSSDREKADPTDYSGATFVAIGYESDRFPRCYANANGLYAITPTSFGLRIVGVSISRQNRVVVVVRGSSDNQIVVQDGPVATLMAVKGGHYLTSSVQTRVYEPLECSGRIATSSLSD